MELARFESRDNSKNSIVVYKRDGEFDVRAPTPDSMKIMLLDDEVERFVTAVTSFFNEEVEPPEAGLNPTIKKIGNNIHAKFAGYQILINSKEILLSEDDFERLARFLEVIP